jgi:hypothetical protein
MRSPFHWISYRLSIAIFICYNYYSENQADVAELVDALDLGSSVFGVRVRVSSSALDALLDSL